MGKNLPIVSILLAGLTASVVQKSSAAGQNAVSITMDPGSLPRLGTVDERFQSYNIEMVEVTGGRFWKPYDSPAKAEAPKAGNAANQPGNQPSGMAASLYEYRPPIDLANPRLRRLAAALGPGICA